MEKRKRAGAFDRQEEEPRRVLLRGGENTVASDVSATKMPCQNGATECDVSGLRTTRRTCTVDTSQTKGILSLLARGKKTREDDEERTKASERDGDLGKVGDEDAREREREKLTDTVTDVSDDGEQHLGATGCPGAYSDRGCDLEKPDGDAAIRECEIKRRV